MRADRPLKTPKGMAVSRSGGVLRFEWRWLRGEVWIVLLVAVLVFCVTLLDTIGIVHIGYEEGAELAPYFVHWLLMPAAGYAALALVLNTTVLEVTPQWLTVTLGPIPVPGAVRLETSEISQLFAKVTVTENSSGVQRSYELVAQLKNKMTKPLVFSPNGAGYARYIEQEVERYLGIEDEPVEGERARDEK